MLAQINGIYGITPDWDDTDKLILAIRAAAQGGMSALQLRRKKVTPAKLYEQAMICKTLCSELQLCYLINDDWQLALKVGADGVHLGIDDGNIQQVRLACPELILGVSCYDKLELAQQAQQLGCDYVAFGSVFASPTKPNAPKAPLALFQHTFTGSHGRTLPKVAIGGITPDNVGRVWQAGANAVAVISTLFESDQIRQQAQALLACKPQ